MALPGELAGFDGVECDCGQKLMLDVCCSAAGYYLGYLCPICGPYSRETGYWLRRDDAAKALDDYLSSGTMPANTRVAAIGVFV